MKIVVTGASGKLGRLVVEGLLKKVPAAQVVLAVRSPEKVADFAARGVDVREADYTRPATLKTALTGTQKLLLVSSNDLGDRLAQHKAVIEAARKAGVKLLAYTSLLHADKSGLRLAEEHRATEKLIRASGMPHVLLRNGFYTENYLENLLATLESGTLVGSAREGRVAAATRADYAAAAVAVLTSPGHENKAYELAGDKPFSMADLATEISLLTGSTISYDDVAPVEYNRLLVAAGLPAPLAAQRVDADLAVARGELNDAGGQLHKLIGRPTTPLVDVVSSALGSVLS